MTKRITTPTVTLEQVAAQFQHWRRTRTTKGKTPNTLIEQAVALRQHYPVTQIVKALRLSHSDFKKHCCLIDAGSTAKRVTTFVPLVPTEVTREPTLMCITLSHPDGRTLQVNSATDQAIVALAHRFWGE